MGTPPTTPLIRHAVRDFPRFVGCTLAWIFLLGWVNAAFSEVEPATRTSVILIVVDALRADRLGVYGNPDGHTPTFDRMASEGVVCEEALSQAPWTQPSIASLFSSSYPGVHGVLDYHGMVESTYFGARKVAVFSDRFVTLAEALKAHGYRTAGFTANPFLAPEYGYSQGFDHWDASFAKTDTPGEVVNEALTAWLRDQPSDSRSPQFLYLHYMDVHGPYNASPEVLDPLLDEVEKNPDKHRLSPQDLRGLDYLRRPPAESRTPERHVRLMRYREYWEARYNACVREMDRVLLDLIKRLRSAGLWDRSYVILTADHGEELFDHGYWDHGQTLYHTELHVPLLLHWPGRLEAGKRFSGRVRILDLMPTLLEQLEIPHWLKLQGESFAQELTGQEPPEEREAYAEGVKVGPPQRALYSGPFKAIERVDSREVLLFDRDSDPLETRDTSAGAPEKTSELKERMEEIASENEGLAGNEEIEQVAPRQEDLDRMKALGYLR